MDRGRYVTLDCMRGIAAMVVACAHVNSEFAPIGFFAVDFFFALSGFVLALAYSSRLNENRRIGWFIRARVVRLFPLFLAGILFGALHKAQLIARGSEHGTSAVELLRSTILGALMLPDPYGHTLYPANPVFWSIACELAVNVVYALVLVRLNIKVLTGIAIGAAVIIGLLAGPPDYANSGSEWEGLPLSLARTLFSFTVGVMLARVEVKRLTHWLSVVLVIIFAALMLSMRPDGMGRAFDLFMIFGVIPLMVFVGSRYEPPRILAPAAAYLGDISYALYALHPPIAHGGAFLMRRLDLSAGMTVLIVLAVSMGLSTVAVRFWDKPVRRFLTARLGMRRSPQPQPGQG